MRYSNLLLTRSRMLVLLLVAVLGIGSIGAVSSSSASSASSAAKKAKKCKKGYKKVGKKCKKKKSTKGAPKPETVVSGATLNVVHQVARNKVLIKGSIAFSKTPSSGSVPAVVNISTASAGTIAANLIIKVKGGDASQSFNELSVVPPFETGISALMTIGGNIFSNQIAVN